MCYPDVVCLFFKDANVTILPDVAGFPGDTD